MLRFRSYRNARARYLTSALPSSVLTWEVSPAGAGESNRTFQRVASQETDETWILVTFRARDSEWSPFVGIARDLATHTRLLPRIIHHDPRSKFALMEDLGSSTLQGVFDLVGAASKTAEELICSAVDALIEWQAIHIEASEFVSGRRLDERSLIGESAFFSREFIAGYCSSGSILDDEWDRERRRLAGEVADLAPSCLHRDLHSENIMMTPEGVRFVDFASTCTGPTEYDLAALLFDPLLELSPEAIEGFHHRFRVAVTRGGRVEDRRALLACAAQRLMNVLGSHARFVRRKGRYRYTPLIPRSLANLQWVLEELGDFPRLSAIVSQCSR